jgi:hypothetical protein
VGCAPFLCTVLLIPVPRYHTAQTRTHLGGKSRGDQLTPLAAPLVATTTLLLEGQSQRAARHFCAQSSYYPYHRYHTAQTRTHLGRKSRDQLTPLAAPLVTAATLLLAGQSQQTAGTQMRHFCFVYRYYRW